MSLRNPILVPQAEEVGLFFGMDSTSPITSVKPGFLREAWNCRAGLSGGFQKRGGIEAQLDSSWTSKSITAGVEFNVSGTSRTVLFGTEGSGTTGVVGYDNAGTMSSIVSSLDGTVRPHLIQAEKRLIFMNGSDSPIVYDGSTTRQFGITAPAAAPSSLVASNGAGALTVSSSYQFCYTYYNSTTGAESSPSDIGTVSTGGADDTVAGNVLAGSSSTADYIRLYRTFSGGQNFYLDQALAIAATTFTSVVADNALDDSVELEVDNSRLEDYGVKGKYPVGAQNRIFVYTDRNEVRFSKIGLARVMPESFAVNALISTVGAHGDADEIVGLAKAGEVPIALKARSVGAFHRRGFADFSQAFDSITYDYVELSAEHGAVSHWGATEVLGECIYLGFDNVYGTRGQPGDLRPVADSISSTIKGLGFTAAQRLRISAANNTRYKYIIISVFATSASSHPDWQLVGDYQNYPNFRWTVYRTGTNTSTHPGWKVGSLFSIRASDGSEDVYYGNSNADGQYYKTETDTSDDGYGIWFRAVTRPYTGASSFNVCLWKKALTFAQGDGNDYDLTLKAIFDISGEEERSKGLSLDPGGAEYDTAIFDTDVFSGNDVPPRTRDLHRKANHVQLVYEQTEADAPVTIFQWQVSGVNFPLY